VNISIEDIKKLKELSGIGLTDAKVALVEAKR
jgi:translation elongation factor EF-Ts